MHHNTRRAIQQKIFMWYMVHGRHDLPWRQTNNLYRVAVAEIMLQQTNVSKVIEKYKIFLRQFPSWRALAHVPQSAVVMQWRGLGYNRRALNLHKSAQIIVSEHGGHIPQMPDELIKLPGFGPYTSHAVLAFGRNVDTAAVDVNIERLLRRWRVADDNVQNAAEEMLPHGRSRDWHNALMDFASVVCTKRAPKCLRCPLKKVCPSYPDPDDYMCVKKKESGRSENGKHIPRRIYRGRIVEVLRDHVLDTNNIGQRIKKDWNADEDGVWLEEILDTLRKENIIVVRAQMWRLQ